MLNKAIIEGRLTKDIEITRTKAEVQLQTSN